MAPRIANQHSLHLGLQQIVPPGCPGPFFPGYLQLAPQTVDELQNAAGFGFHDRLHHQLAAAVLHGDYGRFLVHVHTDILNVATHSVASLGERSFASNGVFPSRYSAILPWRFLASFCHPTVLAQIFTRPFSHNALAPLSGAWNATTSRQSSLDVWFYS